MKELSLERMEEVNGGSELLDAASIVLSCMGGGGFLMTGAIMTVLSGGTLGLFFAAETVFVITACIVSWKAALD